MRGHKLHNLEAVDIRPTADIEGVPTGVIPHLGLSIDLCGHLITGGPCPNVPHSKSDHRFIVVGAQVGEGLLDVVASRVLP